jgi:PAS domain S-box-containing protein
MPRALIHAPVEAGARASSIRLPDHQPLTLLLIAAPAVATMVGLVALFLGVIASPGQVLAAIVVPSLISGLLVFGRRWPTAQLLAAGLLELEAVVVGMFGFAGGAFSLVLPLIAIGLVQPMLSGRPLAFAFALSAVAAIAGCAVALFIGPAHILVSPLAATLTVIAFGSIAIFALALEWRVIQRLTGTLAAAQREIEARDAAEAELDRTSEILSAIIRSSPVATQAFAADRTITIWNPASERIFGWTAEELIGHALPLEMIPEDDRQTSAERIARTLSGAVANGDRVRRLTKDGEERWIDIYAAPIQDRHGRPIGIAGQLVDVTERVQLDAQLLHAQKMGAVGLLASSIAHDFNNTLTAAGGYAELIASTTSGTVREDAATIVEVVDRGRQLTRQLLDFSRHGEAHVQVVDVRTAVAGIEPLIRRLIGPSIEIAVVAPTLPTPARLDTGQFEQALINLALNARDAMPDGGRLEIAIGSAAATDPALAGLEPDDAVVGSWSEIRVTDTGVGIPATVIGSIFEPFFTTKPIGSGTGLGLAMVRGFAENAGGRLGVESTVGQGTTFRILLPPAASAELEVPGPAGPRPRAWPHVLRRGQPAA